MSWILNPEGDGGGRRRRPNKIPLPTNVRNGSAPGTPTMPLPTPGSVPTSPWTEFPLKDNYPKVPDPVEETREVSTKQANRPFLAYAQHRERKKQEYEEWLKRKKERQEKLARGEEVGPEEPDPTHVPEVGLVGLLKFLVISILVVILAGKFFTGSYLWEQELPDLRALLPTNDRLFSEKLLATFDGEHDGRPTYLAIDGDVYDVSSNRHTYGPGGSYHFMAGRDAARAFATGCFQTHLTHDIRGLSDREMQGLTHWKKFFADSKKYPKVGRVLHEPINPMSSIPEPCNPKQAKPAAPPKEAPKPETKHDEL